LVGGKLLNTFTEVVEHVTAVLNSLGLEYMLVGSVAASIHGFVRDTHDLDVLIALRPDSVAPLEEALGDGFYLDEEAAQEAISRQDMFNIIHYTSGVKVDFWMLKNEEFATTQFDRRQSAVAWGLPTFVQSPEDTILSKLLWYRISPSERQLSDVKGILAVKKSDLDLKYLRGWAKRIGVDDLLAPLTGE
jgi:hypothetical protein